jgi:hypothetical protein
MILAELSDFAVSAFFPAAAELIAGIDEDALLSNILAPRSSPRHARKRRLRAKAERIFIAHGGQPHHMDKKTNLTADGMRRIYPSRFEEFTSGRIWTESF